MYSAASRYSFQTSCKRCSVICAISQASEAFALGESLSMIGKLLGHPKVATTARYAYLVQDAEKAAAARTGHSIGAHLAPNGAGAA